MGLDIDYRQPQQQVFVYGFVNLHIVLRLSSTIQCIDELLMSAASRLHKHRKWLLKSIMSHTGAIDWAMLISS